MKKKALAVVLLGIAAADAQAFFSIRRAVFRSRRVGGYVCGVMMQNGARCETRVKTPRDRCPAHQGEEWARSRSTLLAAPDFPEQPEARWFHSAFPWHESIGEISRRHDFNKNAHPGTNNAAAPAMAGLHVVRFNRDAAMKGYTLTFDGGALVAIERKFTAEDFPALSSGGASGVLQTVRGMIAGSGFKWGEGRDSAASAASTPPGLGAAHVAARTHNGVSVAVIHHAAPARRRESPPDHSPATVTADDIFASPPQAEVYEEPAEDFIIVRWEHAERRDALDRRMEAWRKKQNASHPQEVSAF